MPMPSDLASFAAAGQLGISINSVRRRVVALERAISHQLLVRGPDGIRLTDHGVQVMAMAKKMEDNAFDLLASSGLSSTAQIQTIKFAVQGSIAPLWIAPRLSGYHKLEPNTLVELISGFMSSDVLKLEPDVTLQIGRPPDPEFESVRLGRIHAVPTVSSAFLTSHPLPKSLDDLKNLPLSLLDLPLSVQTFSRVFPGIAQEELIRLRTNSSMVQLMSVLNGNGVAWMPTFIYTVMRDLRLVPIDRVFSSDIWLSRRKTPTAISRIDNLWNWVIEIFDQTSAPWFRDEYVSPDDFPKNSSAFQLSLR